ncbi:LysM peptidoglycan-binding domain-containing protein [Aureispira anguillae]|uniref:LysM peptidoglycan-binding domain-containing protein n=1 Tax=Aureispira anguillae TaxID=2864201 RepID=A0A916DV07_9BACT|nr:LysM peptidoglycan-binding domain-containing protein [Aureispira anguillae]BDS13866.1 LysM peptidoglycan-binding domain-containing protein [Aureispira anguillae]
MLTEKYKSVLDLGLELNIQNGDVKEEEGKLKVSGTAKTPYEKNLIWDEIKRVGGDYPEDIEVTLEVADDSNYHIHTVVKGESLSKIAKHYYRNAMKYPKIFEANTHILKDPNKIRPGQELFIPNLED